MFILLKFSLMPALIAGVLLMLEAIPASAADPLAEYLFWGQMGQQAGNAVGSYNDYQRERQSWRDHIAKAQREYDRCGGCASAKADLDKWTKAQKRFNAVAGALAESVGMPPIVAKWLNIPIGIGVQNTPLPEARLTVPDWAKERPGFCQAAVLKHVKCLLQWQRYRQQMGLKTHSYDAPQEVGAECYETKRQYRNCARKDYDAFAREAELEKLRASGKIIPELVAAHNKRRKLVYYGRVPDNFSFKMPPEDVIGAARKEKDTSSIEFVMVREGQGKLDDVVIAPFFHSTVAPGMSEKCLNPQYKLPEVENRICEDLIELTWHYGAPLLVCSYKSAFTTRPDDAAVFWYGGRPEFAALDRLLKRDNHHIVAQNVADPRTECPQTLTEASKILAQYKKQVTSVAARTPQVPMSVKLPLSDWGLEQERKGKEANARREARERRLAKAMDDFPIEGRYRVTLKTDDVDMTLDCAVIVTDIQMFLRIGCRDQNGVVHTAKVSRGGGALAVDWRDFPTMQFSVDVSAREAGKGDILVSGSGASTSRMVRRGDLTPFSDVALPGKYILEITREGETLRVACTIVEGNKILHVNKDKTTDELWEYPAECATPDGKVYKSPGNPIGGAGLDYDSWYPTRFNVGGKQVTNLYFLVDEHFRPDDPKTIVLSGYADPGVSARFILIRRSPTAKARIDRRRAAKPAKAGQGAPQDADRCPRTMSDYHGKDNPLRCLCPSDPSTMIRVYGSGPYAYSSNVCAAAVHAGVINKRKGGLVVVEHGPAQQNFEGSQRNGIAALSLSDDVYASRSFRFGTVR